VSSDGATAQPDPAAPAHRVGLVTFDDFQLLDLAGPADVFRTATLLGASPGYRLLVASPDGGSVRSVSGIEVRPELRAAELSRMPLDTLMVVGGLGVQRAAADDALLRDVRAAARRSTRTTSVCSGALLLAAAGLLDGYEATTHWSDCELLARHTQVQVHEDRIYVHDRDRWTSAGVSAGIDLALALVEADHGPELAHQVAAWLVVFVRRPGGQSQFSSQLRARPARRQELRDLQRWVPEHLTEDLSVAALARRAAMSERTFVRAWREETGTTPAAYVEQVRLEAARRLLESTDLTVDAVAREVGLGRAERLHRAVRRRLGTTPDRYRQHFAHR
jgi:transcriptional regulator GlxA family with amidase domain